jgi:aminopeptidase-like protein
MKVKVSREERDVGEGLSTPLFPSRSCREFHPGEWMHAFATGLYPICRSITGDGLRATLRRIQQEIPIAIHEVPSGTQVLDWTIPDEWNIRDAWIKNSRGERVVDFQKHNLHVMNYSVPVRAKMALAELRAKLHTLPAHPEWIPYRTSYYKRDWGFCLAQSQLDRFADGEYEVCIDSTLAPGALPYGELLVPGETEREFLISAHCCHPSLANDNLSGIAVAVALAKQLSRRRMRFSFRFLFAPGTIGAITWLARNETNVHRIKAGLVLTCVGNEAPFTFKRSRDGAALIDGAVESALKESGTSQRIIDFSPIGYDERQFCSPGFNLPVGCLMRSQHGTFPEYHTSADNLDFITPEALDDTLSLIERVIAKLESGTRTVRLARNSPRSSGRRFINLKPKGEPQLGRYGVYEALNNDITAALWVLNFSDGAHSLDDIANRSGLAFDSINKAADVLASLGLIKEEASA